MPTKDGAPKRDSQSVKLSKLIYALRNSWRKVTIIVDKVEYYLWITARLHDDPEQKHTVQTEVINYNLASNHPLKGIAYLTSHGYYVNKTSYYKAAKLHLDPELKRNQNEVRAALKELRELSKADRKYVLSVVKIQGIREPK